MSSALRRNGLGQIVDFVPNHMGIGPLNPYWMDVLENGQGSRYAPFFDIDWHPLKEELAGKVLLPILGDQYGRVLEKGELKLNFEQGCFYSDLLRDAAADQSAQLRRSAQKGTGTRAACRRRTKGGTEIAEHRHRDRSICRTALRPHRRKWPNADGEKEVIKKRLERVCHDHPRIAEADPGGRGSTTTAVRAIRIASTRWIC